MKRFYNFNSCVILYFSKNKAFEPKTEQDNSKWSKFKKDLIFNGSAEFISGACKNYADTRESVPPRGVFLSQRNHSYVPSRAVAFSSQQGPPTRLEAVEVFYQMLQPDFFNDALVQAGIKEKNKNNRAGKEAVALLF
ncbi:hypothetical protein AMECASPLE_028505 [Ameca splendens]|uniref:Uncharacterized protein n=1 Tax=Ameca splendens TaxID=208324 RepID=A0ABV0XIL3_9TELE